MVEPKISPGSDEELRRLFQELRERDFVGVPPFAAVLERRQREGRAALARARALAVATVAASFFLLVFWLAGSSARSARRHAAAARSVALQEWKAPTDFLLRTPGAELLYSTPALNEPIPDYSRTQSSTTEKGVQS